MNINNTKKTNTQELADNVRVMTLKEVGIENDAQRTFDAVGYSNWIRALMQNWRQGTVGCKGRSDVAFSNRKPWKQKGTGRARAGSLRSPIWRKGGVSFGPQPRVRTLAVNSQVKKNVLGDLAYYFLNQGRVVSLDWTLHQDQPKTALAYGALKAARLHNAKLNLFLGVDDMANFASFANIPNVRILFFDQANAFDVSHADYWVFLNKDMDNFKQMVAQWI